MFVRYEYKDAIQEDFLFCQTYFSYWTPFVQESVLDWKKVCWGLHRWGQGDDRMPQWCSCPDMQGGSWDAMDTLKDSRGKVLSSLYKLHKQVRVFLQDKNFPLSHVSFEHTIWLSQLAYLSDIFSHLNDLNLGLQGLSVNVFDVKEKNQLTCWKTWSFSKPEPKQAMFQFPLLFRGFCLTTTCNLMTGSGITSLRTSFPSGRSSRKISQWHPLGTTVWETHYTLQTLTDFTVGEQESLIELSCDETLKSSFKKTVAAGLLDTTTQGKLPALR